MLAEKILKGDVRATARLIRKIDDGDRECLEDLRQLYRHTGKAHIVGFTGSPGVGKSTLVDQVVSVSRSAGKTVGVLAVDPTSPFSGGAILGDRVRMQKHFMDDGVFIRSMATRGAFGGLTRSTADAIITLDAMGKDIIIVETVGVGQDEVDIADSAHTTIMVTVPGMGDDIQAIKAGLMEIGDIFVVNKADREGAAKTVRELTVMLEMSMEKWEEKDWRPPILETQAVSGLGVDQLYSAMEDHWRHITSSDPKKMEILQARRTRKQLLSLVNHRLMSHFLDHIGGEEGLKEIVGEIVHGNGDPYAISQELTQEIARGGGKS